jgi:hypothetical protein
MPGLRSTTIVSGLNSFSFFSQALKSTIPSARLDVSQWFIFISIVLRLVILHPGLPAGVPLAHGHSDFIFVAYTHLPARYNKPSMGVEANFSKFFLRKR